MQNAKIVLSIYLFFLIFSVKAFAVGPVYWTENTIVIDALNSTSTTAALSANQGKNLNDRLGGSGSLVVVGPATSTDNHAAIFDGVTGKLVKETPYTMPTDVGVSGQLLTIDGIGIATWSDAPISLPNDAVESDKVLLSNGLNTAKWLPYGAVGQVLTQSEAATVTWKTPLAVPTCTGSQRLTGNGTTLSCVDNNFTNLGSIAAAGTATCIITANHICYYTALGASTVAFSGTPVNGMIFQVVVTSTAAYTIGWPTMKWPGGTAITSTKANAHSVFTIIYTPGGYLVTAVEDLR